ncbi:MAG: hypothetical protein FJZ43_04785, partial [Candidatus Staskawiczbacteria bacterium]|nr:hypothetical protein [Candidatus Staskawiczbacteria bacterium]
MNKITKTRIGDDIHYYANGVEGHGIVAKMGGSFITIFKEDGKFYEVPMNDTFYVADILINKVWNEMTMEERAVQLEEIRAYSPRFLAKTWQELPQEIRDIMKDAINKKPTTGTPKELTPEEQLEEENKDKFRTGFTVMGVPANQLEANYERKIGGLHGNSD